MKLQFKYSPMLVFLLTSLASVTMSASNFDDIRSSESSSPSVINNDEIISFVDPVVKALCVENWDTNGDGELSKTEAGQVAELNDVFRGNESITSFDELVYFTWIYTINNAFEGCTSLKSVTLPDDYAYDIDDHAFYGCTELLSITIPEKVKRIGNESFYNCSGLTSINIPEGVTSIGDKAFHGCNGLTSITIPSTLTSMEWYAFEGCSGLYSLTISEGATTLGYQAFLGCNRLTSIIIPSSITSIDESFIGCSGINRIRVASDNPVYDSRNYCNAIIKKSNNQLVFGCKSTIIPSSVTSIGDKAFHSCDGLTSITIPSSVTSIGYNAFAFCDGLTDVYCYIENPSFDMMGGDVFRIPSDDYSNRTLYVPAGSIEEYQASSEWYPYFGSIKEIPVQAISLSLNMTSAELIEGNLLQLTATVLPSNTTDKTVTWTTSNINVAAVSRDGLVTAKNPGSATITATTTDGSNLSASCEVAVIDVVSHYDNFLSMSDTTAFHGDTIVIPVKMTNAASIISFQTDIFMPEGLELQQEDGEYVIEPSDRMTLTHSIICNDVSSGAIRVICYSSNYKPFTGSSGDDLFYITVKVADGAEGDHTIQLQNTLFTTSDFGELNAPDTCANVNVKAYLPGDANNSGTVSITDVVVTSQYVLELNPQPFIFEAADVNADNNITVTDVSRIAWMVLNPALNSPLCALALWNNGDRMSAEDITLKAGETLRVSILLDNEMTYSAFQLDLNLPEGLTASNFQLTNRASSHSFDVSTLQNGNIRTLCYSPELTVFNGHEGALLTFDVIADSNVNSSILVDGIELVSADCQSVKLDAFSIGVNNASSVNELTTGKAIARIEYFNLAGQRLEVPSDGMNIVVTIYSDGSRNTLKIMR